MTRPLTLTNGGFQIDPARSGACARRCGRSVEECPYTDRTPEGQTKRRRWLDAYRAANEDPNAVRRLRRIRRLDALAA